MATLKVDPACVTEADKKPADLEKHLKSEDFFNVKKILLPISTEQIGESNSGQMKPILQNG